MEFKSKEEERYYLKRLIPLGFGSQGECFYRPKENDVLKIFHDFDEDGEEEYAVSRTREEILRFTGIENKTFIWPTDIVTVNEDVTGYISPYVKANNLCNVDPLTINLDDFISNIARTYTDIKKISNSGVRVYDIMYNILYKDSFYVIDQDEYSYTETDPSILLQQNKENFNYEIYYFLIDRLFDGVVRDDPHLSEMYASKKTDVLEFIRDLRIKLGELSGQEIHTLRDASRYRDKGIRSSNDYTYIRRLTRAIN